MRMGFCLHSRPSKGLPLCFLAFTLIELLVVVAIIGVLVSLLMPALAKTRQRALDLQCRSQISQLTLAWILYADDNEGRLAPNRLNSAGSWVGGVMGVDITQTDSTNIQKLLDPAWSKLGPYVKNPKVFKCPLDLSRVFYGRVSNPRVRSYSMNASMGLPKRDGTLPFGLGYRSYQRSSDMLSPGPAQLWVLTEEHPDGIADCVFTVDLERQRSTARFISVPAYYHNAAANFSFADGHVERHRWQERRSLLEVKYCGCLVSYAIEGYYTDLPYSPDVAWLQSHSSSKN